MCGICGFTGKIVNCDLAIKDMTNIIMHRGPDSSGYCFGNGITMGFCRLSIIDVCDDSNQPIYNEDKTLVLTFNGEIYNYKELQQELIKLGHVFYTQSDSEVLVHAFEEWREKMLDKLRGMFAFAIWDKKDNSLFMARDFFGIQPLYYTQVENSPTNHETSSDEAFSSINGSFFDQKSLVWASEIKSILKFPKFKRIFNEKALNNYLSFQYVVPPETFFEGIYVLLPGHYLWYKNGKIEITRYFEATFNQNKLMTLKEAVANIRNVMEDSVEVHRISDVEVGCFLSSGVDSSYIASYFKDHKAFTVGFDFGEKYNEIDWANKFAQKIGLNHYCKIISSSEFWDSIKSVQYMMDSPLADPSCIALYFVAKLASKYVKVVVSGEGADELFCGYQVYRRPRVFYLYQKILPKFCRSFLRKMVLKAPYNFKGK
ncbi:MAG: asparagine synthetase B, partial [Lactobacillales bacterium]|nr:asparagine synthetase B [Lactobacillales bacterium]